MKYIVLFLLVFVVGCKNHKEQKPLLTDTSLDKKDSLPLNLQTPEVLLQDLFVDVQLKGVFTDSKTFIDCVPKHDYEYILNLYHATKNNANFNLKAFVENNFSIPQENEYNYQSNNNQSAKQHIVSLWPILTRSSDSIVEGSSLIPLPQPYVVPGGRFREVYYWDSYFTMLGLVESREFQLIEHMLDNFAYLIDRVGHIPNANRTYYASRSQPPFFSQMVKLLAEHQGNRIYTKYKQALKKEYDFWMKGSNNLSAPYLRCVPTQNGVMNRYFDDKNTPREDSYKEDYILVSSLEGNNKMYTDIRASAESGWDYSSRWFKDGIHMQTIATTDIIPVDLNALLYGLEEVLTIAFKKDVAYVTQLKESMNNRIAFLNTYCWDSKNGVYNDYDWVKEQQTSARTLAMAYPLFFKMASEEQANNISDYIEKHFLKPGGVVTSTSHTNQKWDAPNGWAPLQWITVIGLKNYGHNSLAHTIAERWMSLNERVYANTGKFVEKYNVENMNLKAAGSEYPLQDGFGWSNGVYLAFDSMLHQN